MAILARLIGTKMPNRCRLANAVRLTINPSSVADVEGVRDVALALKATKKLESKATKAKQDTKASTKDGQDEPQPLSPNAPRWDFVRDSFLSAWRRGERNIFYAWLLCIMEQSHFVPFWSRNFFCCTKLLRGRPKPGLLERYSMGG